MGGSSKIVTLAHLFFLSTYRNVLIVHFRECLSMYLEITNFVALGWFMFCASIAAFQNKDYKFALGVIFLGLGCLLIPTQFFIDFSNFLWPSR